METGASVTHAREGLTLEPTDWMGEGSEKCLNAVGEWVESGSDYTPQGSDACMTCKCMNGTEEMCKSSWCIPPSCSTYRPLENECCKFVCLEPTPEGPDNVLTTAGVRMIASTITCLLILVVIGFLMNKLRRHRLSLNLQNSRRRHRDHPSGEVVSYVANGEGRDEPDIRFGHMIQEAPPPYKFLNDDDCSPPPYVPIPGVHPPFVLSNGLSNGLISLNDPLHTARVGLNEISTLARGHDCQTQPGVQHQQRQTAGEVAGVELNSARNSSGLSSPGVSDRSLGIFSSAQSTPGAVYSNMGTLVDEHQCSGSRELVENEAASRVKMENNGHVTENSGGAGQGNSSTNECSLQASSNDRVKARADRIATLLKSSSGSNPGNRTSAGAVAENSNSNNSQGTAAALPARSECAYRCETSTTPVHSMSNHLSRAQNSEFNSTGPESLGYSEEGSGHRMSGETDTDGGLYDPHNEDTNLLPPHNAM